MITSALELTPARPTSDQTNTEVPKVKLGYLRRPAKSRRFCADSKQYEGWDTGSM